VRIPNPYGAESGSGTYRNIWSNKQEFHHPYSGALIVSDIVEWTMKFATNRTMSAICVFGLVLASAGCSAAQGASHGPLEKTNLIVDDFPSVDSAGLYIAQQLGLFKAQGLNVTIVPVFTSSQQTVTNIEKGAADISSGDYVTYMDNELLDKAHLEIIGEASILEPNQLALFVKDGSSIERVSQLEGKTVSVAGHDDIATLLIDSLLSDNGVPSSKVTLVPGTPLPADPALISKGAFTAAPIPEPYVSEGEEQYGLAELADLDQGGTQNFPIQGFAVTQAWAQANPNTLKAFVTALDQGQQIADTDRAAVQKAIEQQPLKVTPGIAAVIALPDFPTAIDPARLQRVVDDMIQFGFLPKKDESFDVHSMVYSGNLASAAGSGVTAGN
jgi:NitT/TauT family transport system substrate-binding protein